MGWEDNCIPFSPIVQESKTKMQLSTPHLQSANSLQLPIEPIGLPHYTEHNSISDQVYTYAPIIHDCIYMACFYHDAMYQWS